MNCPLVLRWEDSKQSFVIAQKGRAETSKARLELIRGDIRDFEPSRGEFDLALSLNTSLGYFTLGEHVRLLSRLADGLRENGSFLVDLATIDLMRKAATPQRLYVGRDGKTITRSMTVRKRKHMRWLEVCFATIYDQPWSERDRNYRFRVIIFDPGLLCRVLIKAGFTQMEFFRSLSGEPFRPGSDRMIVVARKGN